MKKFVIHVMEDLQLVSDYIKLKYPYALPFMDIIIKRVENNFKLHGIPIKYLDMYGKFAMGGYKKHNPFYLKFENFMHFIHFLLFDDNDNYKILDHNNHFYEEIQNTSTKVLYEGDYVDINPQYIVLIYNINNKYVLYTVVDDIDQLYTYHKSNIVLDEWKYKNIKNSNKFNFIKLDNNIMTKDLICKTVKDKIKMYQYCYEYINE